MIDRLKQLLDKEPFQPFKVILTSGGAYQVLSPYQVAIGETQLDYYYPRSNRSATIRINQIVAFETTEELKH
jgi:hypothetical protein